MIEIADLYVVANLGTPQGGREEGKQRWHALEARGKPRSVVVVAVARELTGHCWALATMQ